MSDDDADGVTHRDDDRSSGDPNRDDDRSRGDTHRDGRPETAVPAGVEPLVCPHCGFELPDEKQYRLHLGLEHYGRLAEADREAFRETYRAEEDALTRFRIVALGGLVVLYFGFLVVYALFAI
jgi:hypothetical protein